jgi:probable HAF family extracellular repeat protein
MPVFNYTTLDDPSGISTVAQGINATGQIVGSYTDNSNKTHGFLYTDGTYVTLDFPGAILTQALGIDASGQVVGIYIDSNSKEHSFLFKNGVFSTIDDPAVSLTVALGIDNNGDVVGILVDQTAEHAFIRLASGAFFPNDPPGAMRIAEARGISNDGTQIAGRFDTSTAHGYLEINGVFTQLDDTVTNALNTEAEGVNNAGQVVGEFQLGSFEHGFLYNGGTYTTLDVPGATSTVAFGINDLGQIVGSYTDSGNHQHGFLLTITPHNVVKPDDLNGDRLSDVLWRNTNGSLADWTMNGGNITSSSFVTANGTVVAPDASFSVAGLSDFSGDGNTDVLWRSTSGALIEWRMNGSVITASANVTSNGAAVQPDASFSVAGVGDFSGDNKSDILWRSTSGALIDWTMNGAVITTSANVTFNGALVQPNASFSVAGIGDFNGDGKADIIWRSTSGEIAEWQMNGSTISASGDLNAGGVAVAPAANWSVAGVGDFNADGNADLLWRDSSSGALVEWLMNGSSIIGSGPVTSGGTPVNPDPSWHVVEIGDFNGDARADILWRNDNGSMAEWFMNGTTIVRTATPSFGGAAVTPDASFTVQAKPTDFA